MTPLVLKLKVLDLTDYDALKWLEVENRQVIQAAVANQTSLDISNEFLRFARLAFTFRALCFACDPPAPYFTAMMGPDALRSKMHPTFRYVLPVLHEMIMEEGVDPREILKVAILVTPYVEIPTTLSPVTWAKLT